MLLGALWGGSFLFIRVAVPALGPFLLVELRVGLAVAALFLYALAVGSMPKIRGRWRSFLVLGFFNAAVPFSLISAAEIYLTASLAAILNSTTVMFTRDGRSSVDGRRPDGQESHRDSPWDLRGQRARWLGPAALERGRPVGCGGDAACFALLRAGSHLRQAVVFGHPATRDGHRAVGRRRRRSSCPSPSLAFPRERLRLS